MSYGKGDRGKPPGCPESAPDFARSTGMPDDRQLTRSTPRAPNSGQTKMPGNQGGRSSKNPRE